jgi:predicted RNase H-like HicB family nuclease/DNA-binding XRE family transcriptional regulator
MLKYPGIITEDENADGKVFRIEFPDFPDVSGTQGSTIDELVVHAEDYVGGFLEYLIEQGSEIPEPSVIKGDNIIYINVPPEIEAPIIIRRERKALGLTQTEVAKKMNISYRTLQNVERNHRKPSIATLSRIVRAMGKHLIIDIV